MIGADPEGSVYSGGGGRPYLVEGIGEDFWPTTYDPGVVDRVVAVSDANSFATARRVTREEGIHVGGSMRDSHLGRPRSGTRRSAPTTWSWSSSPTPAAVTSPSSTTTAGWPTTGSCEPRRDRRARACAKGRRAPATWSMSIRTRRCGPPSPSSMSSGCPRCRSSRPSRRSPWPRWSGSVTRPRCCSNERCSDPGRSSSPVSSVMDATDADDRHRGDDRPGRRRACRTAPPCSLLDGGHPSRHPDPVGLARRSWRGPVSLPHGKSNGGLGTGRHRSSGLRDAGHPRRSSTRPEAPAPWSRRYSRPRPSPSPRWANTWATSTPDGQPHPQRAREVPGRSRGRGARARLRQRDGGGGRPAPPAPPGDHVPHPRRRLWRHLPARVQVHAPAGVELPPSRSATWPRASRRGSFTDNTRMVWVETPSNPLLRVIDIAALCRAGPRRTAPFSSSTTRLPPPTCSSRSLWALTSSSTRRPSTWAGTATWWAVSSPPPTKTWLRALLSCRTRPAPSRGRSMLLGPAGGQDLGGAHGPSLRQRRRGRRAVARPSGRRPGLLPGYPDAPGP